MSTVDERLMAPGGFSIEMSETTPDDVLALSDLAFSQVVVTSCHIYDVAGLAQSDLVAVARYVGLLRRRRDSRRVLEGAGLPILLGDEDGKGNTYQHPVTVDPVPLYNGSADSWIYKYVLRPNAGGSNGITVGTIASAASPTKSGNIETGDSQRDVLDFACDHFSTSGSNPYEWSIDTAGRLSVAPRATLFPKAVTPTALATRRTDVFGTPSTLDLIPVSRFEPDDDWEDWSSEVYATGPTLELFGTPYTFTGSASLASNPFVDLDGDELTMRRVVTINKSKSNAQNAAIATRKLGRFDDVARRLSLSSSAYDVGAACRVGDSVYVEDAAAGYVDLSVQLDLSTPVFPLAVRVQGMVWPVRDGMGVYVRWWDGAAFQVTDVSPWVVWDEGDARLTVGSPRRVLVPRLPRWLPAA